MEVALAGLDELRTRLKARIDGRKYWIVVAYGDGPAEFICAFEERFYSGKESSIGLNLFLGPLPGPGPRMMFVTIATADKQYAPIEQMVPFLAEHAPQIGATAEMLSKQDVFIMTDDIRNGPYLGRTFYDWIMGHPHG